jgi:hypothetical protein
MSNKFNLDGFSVDEDNVCTAEGGFDGQSFAGVEVVGDTATVDSQTRFVVLYGSIEASVATIPDGENGQVLYVYAANVTEGAAVSLDLSGSGTSISYDTIGKSSILVWSDGPSIIGWIPIYNTGAIA